MKTLKQFCGGKDQPGRPSRSALYKLWAKGLGPDIVRIGGKIFITDEAEARWIAANEGPWAPVNVGGACGRRPKTEAATP